MNIKSKLKTKKVISTGVLIIIILILTILAVIINGVSSFYDTHTLKIRTPLVLQNPVVLTERAEIITPIASDEAKFTKTENVVEDFIRSRSNGHILWNIYGLESTWGKNDPCKAQGLINGFGYGKTCYGGIDEVVIEVNDWFTKRLKEGLSVEQAVCYYNTGVIQRGCPYYQQYLKLNEN